MKRAIYILLAAMLLGLCACGANPAEPTPAAAAALEANSGVTTSGGEAYKYLDRTSVFPFGTNSKVTDIAVSRDHIYVCGNGDENALFCTIDYENDDGAVRFDGSKTISLPDSGSIRALGIASDAEHIYVVTGKPSEDGSTYDAYVAFVFDGYGNIANKIDIDFPMDDLLSGIAAAKGGQFWVYGTHNLMAYTKGGELAGHIADYEMDLCTPTVIGGRLYIQALDYRSQFPGIYIADASSASLIKVSDTLELAPNVSHVQSLTGGGLINDGKNIFSIDTDMQYTSILDWYSLTLDYGYKYKCICEVDEGVFLAVPDSSAEIVCMSIRQKTDDRTLITVAFYGQATETMDTVTMQFDRHSPEYRVECVDYGSDEAGLNRLLTDLSSGKSFDLVVSDGQINPQSGFVDLYPLIDADGALNREDFVPEILTGLESRGALNVIWGGFIIGTLQEMGLPVQSGCALTLAGLPAALAAAGYDGPLFDSFYTKEHLLDCMAPGVLTSAYNEADGNYILDNEHVRGLIALCDACPLEFSFENETDLENLRFSEVLQWKELGGVDDIDVLEKNSENAIAYFDGRNGGDNFTKLACAPRDCYMIPRSCTDVERAWGFLRTLLTSDWQVKRYADREIGLPISREALNTVLNSCLSENQVSEVNYMIANGTVMGYTQTATAGIITDGLKGYFSGAVELGSALETTQSKLNIFMSEQRG